MANNTELNVGILFKMYKLGVIQTTPKTPEFLRMKYYFMTNYKIFINTIRYLAYP